MRGGVERAGHRRTGRVALKVVASQEADVQAVLILQSLPARTLACVRRHVARLRVDLARLRNAGAAAAPEGRVRLVNAFPTGLAVTLCMRLDSLQAEGLAVLDGLRARRLPLTLHPPRDPLNYDGARGLPRLTRELAAAGVRLHPTDKEVLEAIFLSEEE